jgi:hypothetical protein
MTARWRFLCFVILGTLLVVSLERLPVRTIIAKDQVQQKSENVDKTSAQNAETKTETSHKATLVPVYDNASLYSPKPPPQKNGNNKVSKPAHKKVNATPPLVKPSRLEDGDRPLLEVDYEKIGFDEYLGIVERVGRFFVLVSTSKGNGLGPEISLRNKMLYSISDPFAKDLASDRPHLVSDPKIKERLQAIGLPKNALQDQVVLIFNKPFDSLLWDTINKSVVRQGYELAAILKVHGSYEINKKGIFLKLSIAITKNGNKEITLNRNLLVASELRRGENGV